MIPQLICKFKQEKDTKDITFSFVQGTTDDLVNQLVNDELDWSSPQLLTCLAWKTRSTSPIWLTRKCWLSFPFPIL